MPERDRLLRDEPAVYWRQGLYRGTLDIVVDALIRTVGRADDGKGGGVERCKTFGEFLVEFETRDSPVDRIRPELDEMFAGFHARQRPVLWRVLAAQALLYDAFLGVESESAELEQRLDSGGDAIETPATTVEVARAYVAPELERIRGLVATSP
jgi:hypothetical protein